MICSRRAPARGKGKVYKAIGRPAVMYGCLMVELIKRQEMELEVAELKML